MCSGEPRAIGSSRRFDLSWCARHHVLTCHPPEAWIMLRSREESVTHGHNGGGRSCSSIASTWDWMSTKKRSRWRWCFRHQLWEPMPLWPDSSASENASDSRQIAAIHRVFVFDVELDQFRTRVPSTSDVINRTMGRRPIRRNQPPVRGPHLRNYEAGSWGWRQLTTGTCAE